MVLDQRLNKPASDLQAWRLIWLVQALLEPERSRALLLSKTPGEALLERGFWILAAYEVFKASGDRRLLETAAATAAAFLDAAEAMRASPSRLYVEGGSRGDFLQTNLLLAQVWRVSGWMEALLGHAPRALFCENRFQELRLRLRPHLAGSLTPEDAALADVIDMRASGEEAQRQAGRAYETLGQCWSGDNDAAAAVHMLRDVFGVVLWPEDFELRAARDCDFGKARIHLSALPFRRARYFITLKGCGRSAQATSNGKSATRFFGDEPGDLEIAVALRP